jgi:hypothetical protein
LGEGGTGGSGEEDADDLDRLQPSWVAISNEQLDRILDDIVAA